MTGRTTPIKQRSSICYQRKTNRIITWYNRLVELRKQPVEPNKDKEHTDKTLRIRKELKPLDYYIGLIKQITK